MAWKTPRDWTAYETPTAAIMNADLRDQLNALSTHAHSGAAGDGSAFAGSTWTSTWSASGTAPSIGNGSLAGSYQQIGKLVIATFRFAPGTTTTFGTGQYSWSLPVTAQSANVTAAYANVFDASFGTFGGGCHLTSTTAFSVWFDNAPAYPGAPSYVCGQTSPMTWVNGDYLEATLVYEAA